MTNFSCLSSTTRCIRRSMQCTVSFCSYFWSNPRVRLLLFLAAALSIVTPISCSEDTPVKALSGAISTTNQINFGDVLMGSSLSRTIEIKNEGEVSLSFTNVEYAYENKVDEPFLIKWTKTTLAPGETLQVNAIFKPTKAQEAIVHSTATLSFSTGTSSLEAKVELLGRGVEAALTLEPNPVDFGKVSIPTLRTKDVIIANHSKVNLSPTIDLKQLDVLDCTGNRIVDYQCRFSNSKLLVLGSQTLDGLFLLEVPFVDKDTGAILKDRDVLKPGESISIVALYRPGTKVLGQEKIELFINGCAPSSTCKSSLSLQAERTNFAIQCSHSIVDFGEVEIETSKTITSTCTNESSDLVLLQTPKLMPIPQNKKSAFEVTPLVKSESGEFVVVDFSKPLHFSPMDMIIFRSTFAPLADSLNQDLMNSTYELSVTPASPSPGIEELAPIQLKLVGKTKKPSSKLLCPADLTVDAGNPAALVAKPSSSLYPLDNYQWRIVNAPMGAIGTPNQWQPPEANEQSVTFLPLLVGEYILEAKARTDNDQLESCTTKLSAISHGLRITLTWDDDSPGQMTDDEPAEDFDLHLHNAQTTKWGTEDDCHWRNCAANKDGVIWDPSSNVFTGKNPRLDVDNIRQFGLGQPEDLAENISIDSEEIGEIYTVGVNNYSAGNGRTVTVQIFCGQTLVPTAIFHSSPFQTDGISWHPRYSDPRAVDICASQEFWQVAEIEFTAQGICNIRSLGTVGPFVSICEAFPGTECYIGSDCNESGQACERLNGGVGKCLETSRCTNTCSPDQYCHTNIFNEGWCYPLQ